MNAFAFFDSCVVPPLTQIGTMNNLNLLFFLIAGIFAGLVASSPTEETNAQRLARGLPPKPPKNLFSGFTDGTTGATPRLGSLSLSFPSVFSLISDPSCEMGYNVVSAFSNVRPLSSQNQTSKLMHLSPRLNGRLQLRSCEDGSVLGNVRNWPGGGTMYVILVIPLLRVGPEYQSLSRSSLNFFGPEHDLLVTLTYDPSRPHKINILATVGHIPSASLTLSQGDYFAESRIPSSVLCGGRNFLDLFCAKALS